MKNVFLYVFVFVLIILPLIYLSSVYKTLPQMVPTHFDLNGQPNDMSRKSSLWVIVSICSGLSLMLFFLFRFLPQIDPKRKAQESASTFIKISIGVVLLLSVISCLIVSSAQKGTLSFGTFLPALLGVFFAFMGNVMHSLKPNYFAGIRTPWTLESEETWRKTHQLAGKLWFFGGLLIAIFSILLPLSFVSFFMIAVITIITIIPVVYSYRYFKMTHHS